MTRPMSSSPVLASSETQQHVIQSIPRDTVNGTLLSVSPKTLHHQDKSSNILLTPTRTSQPQSPKETMSTPHILDFTNDRPNPTKFPRNKACPVSYMATPTTPEHDLEVPSQTGTILGPTQLPDTWVLQQSIGILDLSSDDEQEAMVTTEQECTMFDPSQGLLVSSDQDTAVTSAAELQPNSPLLVLPFAPSLDI